MVGLEIYRIAVQLGRQTPVRLAQRMIGQARQQMVQRVVAQAHRRPQRRQGRRRRHIDAVEILGGNVIGSPSFSHRCATRVRTWLRNITPDDTARKTRNAFSGIIPVATMANMAIAQTLAAVSCQRH